MAGFPFLVRQSHAQIAAVEVASLASTFFQGGDLFRIPLAKYPARKRVKCDCGPLVSRVTLPPILIRSFDSSVRRPDDGENGSLESGWKFCPSRDYLGQIMSGCDLLL
jgi:hypothetical protein